MTIMSGVKTGVIAVALAGAFLVGRWSNAPVSSESAAPLVGESLNKIGQNRQTIEPANRDPSLTELSAEISKNIGKGWWHPNKAWEDTLRELWSVSFLLIKIGIETVDPLTLTMIRLIIASIILCLFLLYKRERLPMHRGAIMIYLVVGLLGNTVPFMLISMGEVYVDSAMAAILMGCMPICTFVLAHFFLHEEPMTIRKTIGVGFGFMGLMTLIGFSALSGLGSNMLGEIIILFGAISYAVTTIFVRTQPSFKGYQMAAGASLIAALSSIPLAFFFEDPTLMTPSLNSLLAIVFLGVFATALGSLIYFRVLKAVGATTFAQINYAIPVLGSIWGIIILGESLGLRVFVALGLVLLGVYLIQSRIAD